MSLAVLIIDEVVEPVQGKYKNRNLYVRPWYRRDVSIHSRPTAQATKLYEEALVNV